MRKLVSIPRVAGLFALLAVAGCGAATDSIVAPQSNIVANALTRGDFEVCKTYRGPVGPAVTVNWTVDLERNGFGAADGGGSVQLADGDCATVYSYNNDAASNSGTEIQRVTVTEVVPAGYTASHIVSELVLVVTVGPETAGNSTTQDMQSNNPDNGFSVEFINTEVFVPGGEGCTPGYWKQDHHFDSYPAGLDPTTPFIGAATGFSYDPKLKKPESGNASDLNIVQALSLRGGGVNALIRHAAAGILNANSSGVAYGYSVSEVQDLYNVDHDKGALEGANEAGCPLN